MQKCLNLAIYMTLKGCTVIIILSVTGIYGTILTTTDFKVVLSKLDIRLARGIPMHCSAWCGH